MTDCVCCRATAGLDAGRPLRRLVLAQPAARALPGAALRVREPLPGGAGPHQGLRHAPRPADGRPAHAAGRGHGHRPLHRRHLLRAQALRRGPTAGPLRQRQPGALAHPLLQRHRVRDEPAAADRGQDGAQLVPGWTLA
ncbi:hypothetical protein FOCC_FOCC010703 [Frankliniella occidentalis]|nr:hypothetical protein FOCC_FOCC010703 [Frankliniella occidentalis]